MKFIFIFLIFIFVGCEDKYKNPTYGVYNDRHPDERLVHFENFLENVKHCDEYIKQLNKMYADKDNFYRCQKENSK